jgi:hypothetical protein
VRELGRLCLWAGIIAAMPHRLGEMLAVALRDADKGEFWAKNGVVGTVRVFVWPNTDRRDVEVAARPTGGGPRFGALLLRPDVAAVYSDGLLECGNIATALQQDGVGQVGTDGEDGAGDGT